MKKIIINGDYLTFSTVAGACRFASEILSQLDLMLEDENVILLVPEYTTRLPEFKRIKVVKVGNQPLVVWKNIFLPWYVKTNNALLVDLTQAFPFVKNGITCFFDCIPEIVKESYSGFFGAYIRKPVKLVQRKMAARRCKDIITISECSKKDIVKYYKVKPSKVHIAYCGWQHIERIKASDEIIKKYPILEKEDFLFSLGSRVQHKNIKWIVEAAKQNKDQIFVVSGENSYCKNFKQSEFPDNIIFTGYISDGDIKTLLKKCKAFVLPSIYEGFGIPPLEALAQGSEVIISNTSCFPEIYSNAVHYIDPYNYNDIDINQILGETVGDSKTLLDKYSWENSAKVLYSMIKNNMKSI